MSPRPCSSASTQTGAPIAAQQTAAAPAPEEVQQPTAASGNAGASLMPLIAVMDRLLAPDGCAWDREQTLATLRSYLVEECYELVEAIDSGAPAAICEELGDVLFQVVFQSALCQRAGWFGLDAVAQGVTDKLVRRHPHVFGDDRTQNRDEAIARWEAAKAAEKGNPNSLSDAGVAG
ncbi:MAG: MazG nucleotide pyrophosphohydrolase domain-containing protein, partial [Polyangiales bacterium]